MLKTESRLKLRHGEELILLHLSDIHKGHKSTRIDELERVLDKYSKMNTVFAGTGDFFDLICLQDARFQLSQLDLAGMDPRKFIDDFIDEHVNDFARIWLKYNIPPERVLFFGQGNHEREFIRRTNTNPLKRLCEKLKVPYGGYCGFHSLGIETSGNHKLTVVIYYHHGYGGGSRTGGYPVTKYEKEMIHHDADIFLFGHDHGKRYLLEYPFLSPAHYGELVYPRTRILAINGTFMVTKPDGEFAGYGESRSFPPSNPGYLPIKIRIRAQRMGDKSVPRRFIELKVYD